MLLEVGTVSFLNKSGLSVDIISFEATLTSSLELLNRSGFEVAGVAVEPLL